MSLCARWHRGLATPPETRREFNSLGIDAAETFCARDGRVLSVFRFLSTWHRQSVTRGAAARAEDIRHLARRYPTRPPAPLRSKISRPVSYRPRAELGTLQAGTRLKSPRHHANSRQTTGPVNRLRCGRLCGAGSGVQRTISAHTKGVILRASGLRASTTRLWL